MVQFRRYKYTDNLFEGDFLLVRDFLLKLNIPTYSFGWWEHQITRPSFCVDDLNKFGLWFKAEQLVALACIDEYLGNGVICIQDDSKYLLDEIVEYAKKNLHNNRSMFLLVPDLDKTYQQAVSKAGFRPTQERDTDSIIQIDMENLRYTLPDGFQITDMANNYDPIQFDRVMHRGFSGELEERTHTLTDIKYVDRQFKRPFVNLDLQIVVIAPDKTWAAFCGMWQTKESREAFIEPVVTDPAYQKMGLGKAAVYEALFRCGKLGSESAVVYSSKQFYFSIGFCPNSTSTWWENNRIL